MFLIFLMAVYLIAMIVVLKICKSNILLNKLLLIPLIILPIYGILCVTNIIINITSFFSYLIENSSNYILYLDFYLIKFVRDLWGTFDSFLVILYVPLGFMFIIAVILDVSLLIITGIIWIALEIVCIIIKIIVLDIAPFALLVITIILLVKSLIKSDKTFISYLKCSLILIFVLILTIIYYYVYMNLFL